MNKFILRVIGVLIGLAALIADILYSFELMDSKTNLWWLGIVAIIVGIWLLILYINWIFKPKKQ